MININSSFRCKSWVHRASWKLALASAITCFILSSSPLRAELGSGCGDAPNGDEGSSDGRRSFVEQGIRFSNRIRVPAQANSSTVELQERDLTFPNICLCAKTPSDPRSLQAALILRSLHTLGVRVSIPQDCHRRVDPRPSTDSLAQPHSNEISPS